LQFKSSRNQRKTQEYTADLSAEQQTNRGRAQLTLLDMIQALLKLEVLPPILPIAQPLTPHLVYPSPVWRIHHHCPVRRTRAVAEPQSGCLIEGTAPQVFTGRISAASGLALHARASSLRQNLRTRHVQHRAGTFRAHPDDAWHKCPDRALVALVGCSC